MIWRLRVSGMLLIGATTSTPAHAQADAALARARRILAAHPLIDGHNDLPYVIRENARRWAMSRPTTCEPGAAATPISSGSE